MHFSSIISLSSLASTLLPLLAVAAPTKHGVNIPTHDVVPNSYIVVYKHNITDKAIAAHIHSVSNILSKRDSTFAGIGNQFTMHGFKGYQIETDNVTVAQINDTAEVS